MLFLYNKDNILKCEYLIPDTVFDAMKNGIELILDDKLEQKTNRGVSDGYEL